MQQKQTTMQHDNAAPAGTIAKKSPLLFLALVPVFSIPFYYLERRPLLPEAMPYIAVTALMVFVPMVLALTFVFKESGWRGVRSLLARAIDVHKVKPVYWLLPAFLLLPAALYLAYFVSLMLGNDLGEVTPLWRGAGSTLLVFALVLIPFAVAEELGWMGYAADPLQERWGTLGASVIIGLAWAVWHWVPWYRAHGFEWVFWQTVLDVLLRALIFWIYNNTRGCVFLTVIFHATFNVAYRVFPDQGQQYDPFATVLVLGVITLAVMSIWGSKTLASDRFSMATRN